MKNFLSIIAMIFIVGIMSLSLYSALVGGMGQDDDTGFDVAIATYSNERFNYHLAYPRDIFTQISQSRNGDGAVFASTASDATLRVYGTHNVQGQSISDIRESARDSFAEVERQAFHEKDGTLYGLGEDGLSRVHHMQIHEGDIFHVIIVYSDGVIENSTIEQIISTFQPTLSGVNNKEA